MAQYDEATLQSFYDSRNYQGAANYLKSIPAKNPLAENKKRSRIRQLERDAALQASIINSSTPDQQQAFDFMQSILGRGVIPRNVDMYHNAGTKNEYVEKRRNSYGNNYLKYINGLRSDAGAAIDRISIDVNSDDALAELSSALGYDDIKANDIGISYNALGDGKHRLIIPTSNKNLYKVINAANSISTRDFLDAVNNIATKTAVGGSIGVAVGTSFPVIGNSVGGLVGAGTGMLTGAVEELYNTIQADNKLDIKGVDVYGIPHDSGDYNSDDLESAIGIVNDANKIYDELMAGRIKEQEFTSEVVSTQFLGAGHAEAYKALQEGRIDQNTFNQIEDNWKVYYDRLMINADFTKNPVYAWSADSGEGVNLRAVNNSDVPDLKGEVLLALNEGRCNYALATVDGEIGTMITITPKNDGKEDWSKAKGEVQKMIFVQGLFDETANEVFERDTQTIAARQNADMKKYNYEQTLSSGLIVGYDQQIKSYAKKVDQSGRLVKIPISEAEMLKTLNESAIIDNSVSTILANMDENGNLYPQVIDGKTVQPTVEEMLNMLATAGTNEIYPQGSTTDVSRAAYQNQLYRKMYEILDVYRKNYQN